MLYSQIVDDIGRCNQSDICADIRCYFGSIIFVEFSKYEKKNKIYI